MENELDKRDDLIQERNEKIQEQMQKIEKLGGLTEYKKLYDDLKQQVDLDFRKIIQFIIENKTKLQEILDPLQETQYADSSEEISKLNKTEANGLINLGMEFLREESKILQEMAEEV